MFKVTQPVRGRAGIQTLVMWLRSPHSYSLSLTSNKGDSYAKLPGSDESLGWPGCGNDEFCCIGVGSGVGRVCWYVTRGFPEESPQVNKERKGILH